MTAVQYRSGDRWALVTPGHVVVLPADVDRELLLGLWEEMGDATVESLLSAILSGYKMQISRLPDFAIIARQVPPHVVVRGDLSVDVPGARGAKQASGEGVATWNERKFMAGDEWRIESSDAADDAWLPIREGIVRISALRDGAEDNAPAGASAKPIDVEPAAPGPATVTATAPATTPQVDPEPVPEPEPEPTPEPVADALGADPEPAEPAEPTKAVVERDEEQVDSVSLEQVSLAGEILGPREPVEDTGGVPDDAGPADDADSSDADDAEPAPAEDDPDDADTILVSRGGAAPAQAPAPAPDVASQPTAPQSASVPKPKPTPAQPEPAPADAPGMIDSVPWRTGGARNESPRQTPPPHPPTPPASPTMAPIGGAPVDEGDHDGETIHRSALPTPAASPAEPDDGLTLTGHDTTTGTSAGEFVLGRACAEGHANPPTASVCKACGALLSGEAHQVLRPALGKMVVIEGSGARTSECPLVRSVVLGRQPSARGFTGDKQPKLMQVSSPAGDISRSHLQVKVDGWHVELVDLGATNGTVLIRPGQAPRRLGRNESVLLLDGDIADLGDGVCVRFEDLP